MRGSPIHGLWGADLDHLADTPDPASAHDAYAEQDTLSRLMSLVHQLKPPDRQVMLLYLDGLDAKELRGLLDQAKARLGSGVAVIVAVNEGKASIAAAVG